MRNKFIAVSFLTLVAIGIGAYYYINTLWILVLVLPVILLGISDLFQKKHTLRRNFPVLGVARYIMEDLRPKIYQYFIESETDGTPINRMYRSIVYQRAKGALSTNPFGTKLDVYSVGYEWANHSIMPLDHKDLDPHPRTLVGGPDCTQPYSASIFNVSAMSFGSLSNRAILALNGGAQKGGFAHNTGEGSISPHHLKHGGDLIWQIGTGYFGCRNADGTFSPELYKEKAALASVKMIELKVSQGAKPGHGGILPAEKNTPEIAAIRGVEVHTRVDSPPGHKSYSTPLEMMEFIKQLRELADGKPIGFKLCIGNKLEFIDLCIAMQQTGVKPDFITVDGGEGGTGAAPLEFSNSIGMPLKDGLAFVNDTLRGYGLRKDIKLFASGKILTGFHMFRLFALGADACYSARGMMLSLGCIQALECHSNNCPTGIATQKKDLIQGLDVPDKINRVAKFHNETVHSFVEFMGATGIKSANKIKRHHVYRRVSEDKIMTYAEIYPQVKAGEFA
ncbi:MULTISPECIES: FMN-binding glutamate synthase family protein [Reichenbachiella]|uniref:Glutamate synthase domain-containing protein 2 n=1 Tax=Reichenbachiella agariperforans TaxID=156994 RepID=A0A1M6KH73_REIAG|nr:MULTISPECIES: FMN-binding glutamate synthase family protein [Reichenbachiella]RJE74481.1 glutamate synthase [Reichenbachiella sp. MSK19-1]SHJ58269.1 Glutamate synthase domain-containing protein 2 [Reichenbachiella agariperforans]